MGKCYAGDPECDCQGAYERREIQRTQTLSPTSINRPSIFNGSSSSSRGSAAPKEEEEDLIGTLNFIVPSEGYITKRRGYSMLEDPSHPLNQESKCTHEVTQYQGLFETYPICKKCGIKL